MRLLRDLFGTFDIWQHRRDRLGVALRFIERTSETVSECSDQCPGVDIGATRRAVVRGCTSHQRNAGGDSACLRNCVFVDFKRPALGNQLGEIAGGGGLGDRANRLSHRLSARLGRVRRAAGNPLANQVDHFFRNFVGVIAPRNRERRRIRVGSGRAARLPIRRFRLSRALLVQCSLRPVQIRLGRVSLCGSRCKGGAVLVQECLRAGLRLLGLRLGGIGELAHLAQCGLVLGGLRACPLRLRELGASLLGTLPQQLRALQYVALRARTADRHERVAGVRAAVLRPAQLTQLRAQRVDSLLGIAKASLGLVPPAPGLFGFHLGVVQIHQSLVDGFLEATEIEVERVDVRLCAGDGSDELTDRGG